jgi:hypothetical protein
LASLGIHLGQGGVYDYQREGNRIKGFTQLPQFRNVANVNVGLFCQQAGLPLEAALGIAGTYAALFSSNSDSSQPYFLDKRTAEFIKVGYELGKSGKFGNRSAQ